MSKIMHYSPKIKKNCIIGVTAKIKLIAYRPRKSKLEPYAWYTFIFYVNLLYLETNDFIDNNSTRRRNTY